MVFLQIFTSYRLTDIIVENPKSFKMPPPLSSKAAHCGHAFPVAALRVVFGWAGATVCLLACRESFCGQDHLEWWPGYVHSKDVHVPIPASIG